MERKNIIAKILIVFGLATLLTSAIDYATLLLPLHLSNSSWVYGIVQKASELAIIPALGVIITLCGFYLNDKNNKLMLNMERLISVFCFSIGIGFLIMLLLYALNIKAVENHMVNNITKSASGIKQKITTIYDSKKDLTAQDKAKIDEYLKNVEEKGNLQIKSTKNTLLKQNVKTVFNLVLFILVYLFTGILGFSYSGKELKRLRISKKNSKKSRVGEVSDKRNVKTKC